MEPNTSCTGFVTYSVLLGSKSVYVYLNFSKGTQLAGLQSICNALQIHHIFKNYNLKYIESECIALQYNVILSITYYDQILL